MATLTGGRTNCPDETKDNCRLLKMRAMYVGRREELHRGLKLFDRNRKVPVAAKHVHNVIILLVANMPGFL